MKTIISICFLLFGAKATYAQTDNGTAEYDKGKEAARVQNYTETMNWYHKAADKGNPEAMYGMGWIYEYARGVDKNYPEAVNWYKKAADKGNVDAMTAISHIYREDRDGITKDFTEVTYWLKKAADKGKITAINLLGVMYAYGSGIPKDEAESIVWFQKGADAGDDNSKQHLQRLLSRTVNATATNTTPAKTDNGNAELKKGADAYNAKNYTEAMQWFKQSADKGNATATAYIGVMYNNGNGVAQDYTEAMKWYKQAAEKGNATAITNIGAMYYNGNGVAQDYAEAMKWYKTAAEKGEERAVYYVGTMYYNGKGVTKNEAEAKIWFQKAADKGYEDAKKILQQVEAKANDGNEENNKGIAFYNDKNYKEAIVWYEKAAEKGNSYAMSNLGYLYFNGLGVEQSDAKAVSYYKQSAEKNNAKGNYMMSWITANGFGVPQDTKKAMTYFENAVKLGDKDAVDIMQKAEKGKQQMPAAVTEAQKYITQKKYLPAIVLLEAAADQGNPDAMFELGKLYDDKNFKEDGYPEAYFWLNKGLRLYHENSIELFSKVYTENKIMLHMMYGGNFNDDGFMAEIIGHDNKEDEETALRWFRRSADFGSANGATMAGLILYNPKKVKKDLPLAKQYFEKAKQLGDTTADIMLKEIEKEEKLK